MEETAAFKYEDLQKFTGTREYFLAPGAHKGPIEVHYTEGVRYLADNAQGFALVDAIASQLRARNHELRRKQRTWFWSVKVEAAARTWDSENRSAAITCVPDLGLPPLIVLDLPSTSLPVGHVELWTSLTSLDGAAPCWVIYLPSES